MGTERGGCSRLMKTPRRSGGAYIKQEHEIKEERLLQQSSMKGKSSIKEEQWKFLKYWKMHREMR